MIISRANLQGGRPLRGYPLEEDPKTGMYGYKVGYCSGCNEPVMIRTIELRGVVEHFGRIVDDRLTKRVSLKHRLITWLGGKIE